MIQIIRIGSARIRTGSEAEQQKKRRQKCTHLRTNAAAARRTPAPLEVHASAHVVAKRAAEMAVLDALGLDERQATQTLTPDGAFPALAEALLRRLGAPAPRAE